MSIYLSMFHYLVSLITYDARRTRETKRRNVTEKSALNNEKTIFQQNGLKFK